MLGPRAPELRRRRRQEGTGLSWRGAALPLGGGKRFFLKGALGPVGHWNERGGPGLWRTSTGDTGSAGQPSLLSCGWEGGGPRCSSPDRGEQERPWHQASVFSAPEPGVCSGRRRNPVPGVQVFQGGRHRVEVRTGVSASFQLLICEVRSSAVLRAQRCLERTGHLNFFQLPRRKEPQFALRAEYLYSALAEVDI